MNLKNLLAQIVNQPELHAKWLNTLSMMENCGARKISASEHAHNVDLIVLKHAAEEARHAYYLKNQISKTKFEGCETYHPNSLISPIRSFQYLHQLDSSISRYLKEEHHLSGHELRFGSYLLVTYAIEVRADELYPVYEDVLKENKSPITVRMIIVEEKGHLEEMIQQMDGFFSDWTAHGEFALTLENQLYEEWATSVSHEVEEYYANLQEIA
ncbi:MAG: hypothetical protein ABJG78_09155 [Cyclobacteriaceae bacterium]